MQIQFGTDQLRAEWNAAVACLGTFDGVHLGHQAVIRSAVERARKSGVPCVLATFDRHPASVLAPEKCPMAIASIQSNLERFEELGVSHATVLTFDHRLSETSAEEFLDQVLIAKLRAISIVVGHDFAFGKDRVGTP